MNANKGLRAKYHSNVGTVRPQLHTLQATLILKLMPEQTTDHMPHHTTTVETGEKVVSKCLPPHLGGGRIHCWRLTLLMRSLA